MNHIAVAVTNDLTYDQRMIRSCSALAEAGYRVTLIGRQLPGSIPLKEEVFEQKRIKCDRNAGPGFYAEYNIRLRAYLRSVSFDAAIACDLDTILAVASVCRERGRPFVYDAHEYFSEVPELVDRPIVKAIWRLIGSRYVPRATACYTVAPQLAVKLQEEYGKSFGVVRNVPFRTQAGIIPYEEREPVILYQGALNAGRGVEAAIDAMVFIEDLELHLAGEGDLSETLRIRAKSKGVSERVRFLGRIAPGKLKEYTSRSLIGLNLLENRGLNYYYSLANKFFDYMQAGTPSVNMQFPEYVDILGEYDVGVMLPELSPAALAEQINSLRLPDNWTHHSKACETARQVFHWENEKEGLLEIIEGAIGS